MLVPEEDPPPSAINCSFSPKVSSDIEDDVDIDVRVDEKSENNVNINNKENSPKWQFFNLIVKGEDNSIPQRNSFTDYDVAEIAIQIMGFAAYDLSHLCSDMGPGRALIGLESPCDIINKFCNMTLPFEYTQAKTGLKFLIDIRGLKNALDNNLSRTFRVEALRCVGKVPTAALEDALSLFVSNVKQVGYVRSDANKGSLYQHPGIRGLDKIMGSGSIEFEVTGESSKLPTLLPVNGQIIRLRFPRMKKQCTNCFRLNHSLSNCNKDKVKLSDYHSYLLDTLKCRGKINEDVKSFAQAVRMANKMPCQLNKQKLANEKFEVLSTSQEDTIGAIQPKKHSLSDPKNVDHPTNDEKNSLKRVRSPEQCNTDQKNPRITSETNDDVVPPSSVDCSKDNNSDKKKQLTVNYVLMNPSPQIKNKNTSKNLTPLRKGSTSSKEKIGDKKSK